MKSQTIKLILLAFLVFQLGCDITLKRKDKKHQMMDPASSNQAESNEVGSNKIKENISESNQMKMSPKDGKTSKASRVKKVMRNNDSNIIVSYYSDAANTVIRKDMISHTEISKNQAKKIKIGKILPREIQVMPLPIALEKRLPSLSLHVIRVQVGTRVILMDVKSRRILDIIKI